MASNKGHQPKGISVFGRLMSGLLFAALFLITCGSASAQQTVTLSAAHFGGLLPINGTITFQPTLFNGVPVSVEVGGGQSTTQPFTAVIAAGVFSLTLPDVTVGNPSPVCFQVTAVNTKGQQLLGPGYGCVQPHYTAVGAGDWCQAGVCNFDNFVPNLAPWALVEMGPTGPAATVAIGTVTTLGSGATPTVANGGTSTAAVFNFGIPSGVTPTIAGVSVATGGTLGGTWSGCPSACVLSLTITAGTNYRGPWTATTAYAVGDVVINAGAVYVAPAAFTSTSSFNSANWNAFPGINGTINTGTPSSIPAYPSSGTVLSPKDPTLGGLPVPPLYAVELPVPASTTLLSNTWSAYEAYGTSISFGTGATGGTGTMPYLSTQYTSLIAADMGLTPVTSGGTYVNHAIGQDEMADGARHIFNYATPAAADNTARTMEFGINDARHSGSGAYEDNFNMSARASMSWLMIPAEQKSLASQYSGSLPTNWTMDNTYTANAALTTSTNAATTQFCINTGTKTNNPYWFIWYRRFDAGGSTTAGTFSYVYLGVTHYVYTGTLFPMATWNGASDSIGVVILPASTVSGNVCIPVTMVSTTGTTVSIFGLGAGPYYNASSVSLPLWITGVDRQTLDGQGSDPSQYNADQKANITMFQQMGFNNLYFVNERNFWMSTNADMSPANSPHPNNQGEIEIRNAFEAATPLMPAVPGNTGPTMPFRQITSATNCNISTTDVFVNFNIASDTSCSITSDGLFGNPMTSAVKHITLFNSAPHTVTINSGIFTTGVNAVNSTTLAQNAVVDIYISPGIGVVIGPVGNVNIATGYPCTAYNSSTVAVKTNDGCIVQTGPASVYTLPTTMVAGKSWLIFNSTSGAITFANNGLTTATIPGNSTAMVVATTSTTAAIATLRASTEAEAVVFSATPTFNANILTSRMILTGSVTSFTLAGAQTDGQKKSLCFKQSGAGSLTVTAPANVHGFTAIGATALTWSCETFAWDNTDSIWLATAPAQINE